MRFGFVGCGTSRRAFRGNRRVRRRFGQHLLPANREPTIRGVCDTRFQLAGTLPTSFERYAVRCLLRQFWLEHGIKLLGEQSDRSGVSRPVALRRFAGQLDEFDFKIACCDELQPAVVGCRQFVLAGNPDIGTIELIRGLVLEWQADGRIILALMQVLAQHRHFDTAVGELGADRLRTSKGNRPRL